MRGFPKEIEPKKLKVSKAYVTNRDKQLSIKNPNNLFDTWAEDQNRHFPKEDILVANRQEDAQRCWSSGKCKSKPQGDITLHLSEWPP